MAAKVAMFSEAHKNKITAVLDKLAAKAEARGQRKFAIVLDAIQNELDGVFTAGTVNVSQVYSDAVRFINEAWSDIESMDQFVEKGLVKTDRGDIRQPYSKLKGILSKLVSYLKRRAGQGQPSQASAKGASTIKESAFSLQMFLEAMAKAKGSLDQAYNTLIQADLSEDARIVRRIAGEFVNTLSSLGFKLPGAVAQPTASVKTADADDPQISTLDEESGVMEANPDVVSVQLTSSVRLTSEKDEHNFRVPSFVKDATREKWNQVVKALVESGKGYHQDGTPNYSKAIDQYKAQI